MADLKSSVPGMLPLAVLYEKFYGLKLSLLADGKIQVQALARIQGKTAQGALQWLRNHREHAVERLKLEQQIQPGQRHV